METFNIFKEAKSKIGAKIENTKQYFAEKKANKDNAEESGEFAVNTMSPLNSRCPLGYKNRELLKNQGDIR